MSPFFTTLHFDAFFSLFKVLTSRGGGAILKKRATRKGFMRVCPH